MNCYNQKIIFQPAISLDLAVVERATYTAQLNLIASGQMSGFGNWSQTWESYLNACGMPIETRTTLVGSGSYQINSCPSISSLLGKLQINITYPDNTPLPTNPPIENIWQGSVVLSAGTIIGVLTSDNVNIRPSIYNIRGSYTIKYENNTSSLYVKNVYIISN